MTDTLVADARVFPEDRGTGLQVAADQGDIVSAGDLGGLALQRARGQYVDSGLDLSYDPAGPTATVSQGLAFLRYDSGVSVQDGGSADYVVDWGAPIVFSALVGGTETLSLASNAVNDIYIYINRNQDGGNGIYFRHGARADISEPPAPSLRIATIDTSTDTVTRHNPHPDESVGELNAESAMVDGSPVITESSLGDLQASVSQGGTTLVEDPTDINITSGLAGTDDGDGTVSVGIASGGVTEAMLGFDVTTQAELDTHIGTAGAHHTRYADEEAQDAIGAITDASLVYDDAVPALGVAAGGIGTSHLAPQAVTPTEIDGSGGEAGYVLLTDGTASGASWSPVDQTMDTRIDIGDGVTTVTEPTAATFTGANDASVSVADDGDGTATVTVDVTDTDTNTQTDVEDVNGVVVPDAAGVAFTATNAASVGVTDDGDNTATVELGVPFTVVASNSVALSGGTAVVATGITTPSATLQVALGVQDPNADTKVAARAFWDDAAGEHKIEIVEDGTSVGNPTVSYDIIRWS